MVCAQTDHLGSRPAIRTFCSKASCSKTRAGLNSKEHHKKIDRDVVSSVRDPGVSERWEDGSSVTGTDSSPFLQRSSFC